jgi:endonuclease/exonuclease/phosphatase (EEP) superfamily protein YafD
MRTTIFTMGWLMIAATVIPAIRSEHWAVRVFDFPRLQITIGFVLTFVGFLWLRENPTRADNLLLILMSPCLAYQLWRMWPYTPLHFRQVKRAEPDTDGPSLGVLISNVLMTNRECGELMRLIRERDPDIMLLVETDSWWEERLRELEPCYPHVLKYPQSNTYGMLLYSRLPLLDARIRFLVQDDVPSMHAAVQLPSGEQVQLRCLHPRPPAPGENTRTTERDAELLLVAKELRGQDQPAVVMGDLNDVAWSGTNGLFQKISGLLDPRIGRGFYSTFNANWPLLRFPLDHAFVTRHFKLQAFDVLPHVGSDHFPVHVRLRLSPPTAADQNRPPSPASSGDEQTAESKIARAG